MVKASSTALPPLPGAGDPAEAALAFQDWVEVSSSTMGDISERSGTWWTSVLQTVERTYTGWLAATPLERLAVTPPTDHGLCTGGWSRLNARAASLLLAAMEDEVKNEMVALRITQDSVRMMFRLYVRFQPGGAAERHDVLRRLQAPGEFMGGEDIDHVLKALRSWPRWLARCKAVRMEPPDPTVLAKGLLQMTDKLIAGSADASFRTAMLRTSLRLDAQPSLDSVQAYQKHLQAEIEVLAASARTSSTTTTPKVRTVEASGSSSPIRQKNKEKDKSGEMCRYFAKPSGCKRGEKCSFSHSMATLDREARAKKCLKCGSESHRQRDCTVGKSGGRPAQGTASNKDQRPSAPAPSSTMAPLTLPTPSSTASTTSSTVTGTPWTLETLVQAAQQVVQSQGVSDGESSPEKTAGTQMKVLRINNIHVCSSGKSSAALLDSGATHCLRNAYDEKEWKEAEEILVELAGGSSLVMRMGSQGSLLMPPRSTPPMRSTTATGAQTIVPVGQLVKVLGYTLVWGPGKCFLEDQTGERTALSTTSGCPQLCEAEALALIARIEDRRRETLENLVEDTRDRVTAAAVAMQKSWQDHLQEYVETGSTVAGGKAVRDAGFLRGLPAECLEGLVQEGITPGSWSIMKSVDFLSRAQRRHLWGARRWIVHIFAGNPGHHQLFRLDEGSTAVLELDLDRCKAHDITAQSTWRLLMWGALTGKIDAVVGGPPGRSGLLRADRDVKILQLMTRMIWLYSVATISRRHRGIGYNKDRPVAFVMEHPSSTSLTTSSGVDRSLWGTTLWQEFSSELNIDEVTFDQRLTGAATSCPTTLGTNVYYLKGLADIDEGEAVEEAEPTRRGGATWSTGLVEAIVMALRFWNKEPREATSLKAMTVKQWADHVASGHANYRRDCLTCVMGRGTGKRHARVRHPDSFCLTVDVAGPVKPGVDATSKGAMGKGLRYMVVARFTLPREYVKGFTGRKPPEDDGLGQQGDEARGLELLDKELVKPSLPQPHEGEEDKQQR